MRLILVAALFTGLAPAAFASPIQPTGQAPGGLVVLLAKQVMAELDRNGDNRVDRAEFKAAREGRFAEADTNHDRLLTRKEFDAELVHIAHGVGLLWSEQIFAAIDRDGDGLLSLDEVAATGDQLFALADANGDGFVTPAEVYPRLASAL